MMTSSCPKGNNHPTVSTDAYRRNKFRPFNAWKQAHTIIWSLGAIQKKANTVVPLIVDILSMLLATVGDSA
jgi:hypothetical protein